jgi:RsiW-degrading membrane proteinase PrsW (M82 family)
MRGARLIAYRIGIVSTFAIFGSLAFWLSRSHASAGVRLILNIFFFGAILALLVSAAVLLKLNIDERNDSDVE